MKANLPAFKIRLKRRNRTAPGASPGSLNIAADAPKPQITIYSYDSEQLDFKVLNGVNEIVDLMKSKGNLRHWIDIKGFGDKEMIDQLCTSFNIHRLEMEDVLNGYQRPKMEEHKDHLFIVSRMFSHNAEYILRNEQLSLFLGSNFVISMQESMLDLMDPVRSRLKQGKGYIRHQGSDYLAYAILDAIVDNYFPILESLGDQLDELEDELFIKPTRVSLQKIQTIKRELIIFRRTTFAERDKINDVLRTNNSLLKDSTKVFVRDTYDHTIQVMDFVEGYKEITASLMDIYLSSVSNRMNQIMKVLAVISTIFIPLTFIVGVYGMNFVYEDAVTGQKMPYNMPELYSPYGYVGVWTFMFIVVAFQLWVFYKRGWLEKS